MIPGNPENDTSVIPGDPEDVASIIPGNPEDVAYDVDLSAGTSRSTQKDQFIERASARTNNIATAFAGDVGDMVTNTSALISGGFLLPYRGLQAWADTRAGVPFKQTTLGQQAEIVKQAIIGAPHAIKERVKELSWSPKYADSNFLTRPIRSAWNAFEEHPLNTAIDLSMGYSALGSALRGAARAGAAGLTAAGEGTLGRALSRAALSTEGPALAAGRATIQSPYSKNPLTKALQVATIAASEKYPVIQDVLGTPGIRGLVPPAALSEADRMALVAEEEIIRKKMRKFAQTKDYVKEVIDNVETLSGADEPGQIGAKAGFAAVVEGLASPLDKKLYEARNWWATRAAKDALDLNITPQKQRMIAYQPLVMATKGNVEVELGSLSIKPDLFEKSNKATRLRYVYSEAEAGNVTAMREVYRRANYGNPIAIKRVEKWTAEVQKFREDSVKKAIADFMGDTKTGTPQERIKFVMGHSPEAGKSVIVNRGSISVSGKLIKTGKDLSIEVLTKDIIAAIDPEPVYFPHKFLKKVKMSEWGMPTRIQNERPSFLKGRTGATGYETSDPGRVLALHAYQIEKYRMQKDIVGVIKDNFAVPLPTKNDLLPGNVVFAPDGYLAFYKTALGFGKNFAENLAGKFNIDAAALDAAAKELFPVAARERLVVGRQPLYQIPVEVMRKVQQELQPLSLFGPELVTPVKLFYDLPLEAFKYTVLGLRPAWVLNNVMGNIITSTMGGVNLPSGMLKTVSQKWTDAAGQALNEVAEGGFRRSEQRYMGRIRFQPQRSKIEAWLETTRQLGTGEAIFENPTLEFLRKALTGVPTKGKLSFENLPSKAISMITAPFRLPKAIAEGMYNWNAKVEDRFRFAAYLDFATKEAKKELLKKAGGSFLTSWKADIQSFMGKGIFNEKSLLAKVAELSNDVRKREDLITRVDDVLNNYSRMSSFERQGFRRVIPFWAWWKFINVFGITLVAKHPAMAEMVKALSIVGGDLEKNEWKSVGLDPNEVPIWKRGSAVINYGERRSKMIKTYGGRGANPMGTIGLEGVGLAPPVQMWLERKFGRKLETGLPFTSPGVEEIGAGRILKYNPKTKKSESINKPPNPPIVADLVRRYLPLVRDLELAAYPYRTYDTSGLFESTPILGRTGARIPMDPRLRLASIFGAPLGEIERRAVLYNRPKVRQAGPKARMLLKRLGAILDKQDKGGVNAPLTDAARYHQAKANIRSKARDIGTHIGVELRDLFRGDKQISGVFRNQAEADATMAELERLHIENVTPEESAIKRLGKILGIKE